MGSGLNLGISGMHARLETWHVAVKQWPTVSIGTHCAFARLVTQAKVALRAISIELCRWTMTLIDRRQSEASATTAAQGFASFRR